MKNNFENLDKLEISGKSDNFASAGTKVSKTVKKPHRKVKLFATSLAILLLVSFGLFSLYVSSGNFRATRLEVLQKNYSIKINEEIDVSVLVKPYLIDYVLVSSDPSVAEIVNNKVMARRPGIAEISVLSVLGKEVVKTSVKVLDAKGQFDYRVDFSTENDTSIIGFDSLEYADQKVISGRQATEVASPLKIGYRFINWYYDADKTIVYSQSDVINSNIVLYPRFEAIEVVFKGAKITDGLYQQRYSYSLSDHTNQGSGQFRYSMPDRRTNGDVNELPLGLALSANGNITGIPTKAGDYVFAVTVTDAINNTRVDEVEFRLSIKALVITEIDFSNFDNLIYNGNSRSDIRPLAIGTFGADTIPLIMSFDKTVKNADTYTVTVVASSNTNYQLEKHFQYTFSISPKKITANFVSEVGDNNFDYIFNGLNREILATFNGLCGTDVVDYTMTYSQETTNVGEGYIGTLASIQNSNYTLGDVAYSQEFCISKAQLSFTITDNQTKVYGTCSIEEEKYLFATDSKDLDASIKEDKLDEINYILEESTYRENGENVGMYSIYNTFIDDGYENNSILKNYDITFTSAKYAITKKDVTVTATADTKVYDGLVKTFGTNTGYTVEGMVGVETLVGTLANIAKDVNTYTIGQGTVTNENNGNYNITFVSANYVITPKALTISVNANQTKVYDGQGYTFSAAEGYTSNGLVSGDNITGVLAAITDVNVGEYDIQVGSLTAGNNYTITFTSAKYAITKKDVTVTATADTKVYDGLVKTFETSTGYTVEGIVGAETLVGTLAEIAKDVNTYTIGQGTVTNENNGNYNITFVSANYVITPKALTISVNANQTKVYDGQGYIFVTAEGYTSNGLVRGDSISGVLAAITDVNIGEYDISVGSLTAGNNYTITFTSNKYTITPKELTISVNADLTKVYDGQGYNFSAAEGYTQVGLVSGDSLSGVLAAIADVNVGEYDIQVGSLTTSNNYTITFISNKYTITPKELTISVNADQTKVYDKQGYTFVADEGYTSNGLVSGDNITGVLAAITDVNVGEYDILVGSLTAGKNYTIIFTSNKYTITPKALTISVNANQTKVYDGQGYTFSAAEGYTSNGLVSGDNITGVLAAITDVNVGEYDILVGSLTAGNNYTITFTSAKYAITKKDVTVTATADTKVYDGLVKTFGTSTGYTLEGIVGAETLIGTLADIAKDVNTYTIGQGTVTNENNGNYNITFVSANYIITPKALTISVNADLTKVYDGQGYTFVADEGYTQIGLVNGDSISGVLAAIADFNVGEYDILVGSLTAGNNYTITFTSAKYAITKKDVTVTATANTKVYDGQGYAFVADEGYTSNGLVSGDSISGVLAAIADVNVGEYDIQVGSLTASNNYTITFISNKYTITPKALAISANANQTKVYDGQGYTFVTDEGYMSNGLVSGDNINGVLAAITDVNVGEYDIQVGSLTAGDNYTITFTSAKYTITKKDVTVTATADTKVYDGLVKTFGTNTGYTLEGIVGAETLVGTLAEIAKDVNTYTIGQGTVTNENNGNYNITFVSANYVITPKALTISVNANQTKVYDGQGYNFSADEGYTSNGLVSGDSISGVLAAITEVNVGEYEIQVGSLTAGNNYTITFTSAKYIITKKAVTVTATADTKVYDGLVKTFETSTGYTVEGIVGAETLVGTLGDIARDVNTYAIGQGTVTNENNGNYNITFISNEYIITVATIYLSRPNNYDAYNFIKTYDATSAFEPTLVGTANYSYDGIMESDKTDISIVPARAIFNSMFVSQDNYIRVYFRIDGTAKGNYKLSYERVVNGLEGANNFIRYNANIEKQIIEAKAEINKQEITPNMEMALDPNALNIILNISSKPLPNGINITGSLLIYKIEGTTETEVTSNPDNSLTLETQCRYKIVASSSFGLTAEESKEDHLNSIKLTFVEVYFSVI